MKKRMRKSLKVMAMVMVSGLMSIQVFAADFSDKSLEELIAIRGTLRSASVQERNDFRQEWQSRLNAMTPDERVKYLGPPANALRDGQGYGKKGNQRMGKGYGQGNGQGQGNQNGKSKGKGNGKGRGMGNGQG
ncbi:MAG: DUF1104 domain-containing protein [Deltaproteobacteria bacterium]|jgi:hypothetical protein|nr:DUF1104 domain-containing protein [Deltaproteobacteria bacterium]MBT4528061.1 DUF1104 domain-containing protein [Deltaproteobacteria bacterium]